MASQAFQRPQCATRARLGQGPRRGPSCQARLRIPGNARSPVKTYNSTGMVAIKDKYVTPSDVDRANEAAGAMPIPTDQQVLHILAQEFIIDGQDGVREPLGMSGVRLEVKVHIATGG